MFQSKKIIKGENLGEILKEARLESNISLNRVAKDLNIAFKYLEALEENDFSALPSHAYAKRFLEAYCRYLHLDCADCWRLAKNLLAAESEKKRGVNRRYFFSWPKLIKRISVWLAIIAVAVFLALKIEAIFVPPDLQIIQPKDGLITASRQIEIIGLTEKESTVAINNQAVFIDNDGNFKTIADLQTGLNLIKIIAKKRYSHARVIEIRVLRKEE